jgi:hydrogenase nickel incorporation protein HypA/HybF
MHELGITRHIVAICCEHAAGARVARVTVEIGRLSAVLPDAVRFCFDVCSRGTLLESAHLEIVETPGLGRCRRCDAQIALAVPYGRCACGSASLKIVGGEELKVRSLELAD